MNTEHESVLVKLTRMEGKLDLSNARHDQHDLRFGALDRRLSSHSDRLGILETRGHVSDGERRGIAMSARVGFVLLGAVPTGAVAIALRLAGVL